jgi:copper(I)-binding protein
MNAADGAAYMTITSEFGDILVSAEVGSDIARAVQIHETKPVEDMTESTGMTEDTSMGGDSEMEMVPVESIEIPEGGEVALEPGGLHLMLIGLAAPLEVGTEFEMTLTFATAGKLTLNVPVLDEAP